MRHIKAISLNFVKALPVTSPGWSNVGVSRVAGIGLQLDAV